MTPLYFILALGSVGVVLSFGYYWYVRYHERKEFEDMFGSDEDIAREHARQAARVPIGVCSQCNEPAFLVMTAEDAPNLISAGEEWKVCFPCAYSLAN